jgi:choline dehydrogenase-like flavoprotein
MTHYAYQPSGPAFELETDYVVVGSGAGGATAAVTLARGGASVVLVEAGPWRNPDDYPSSVYGTMRDMFDDFGMTVARGRAFWPVVQARVVGGTTVINSAICVRTPEDVVASWKRERGVGGEPMLRALLEIEDELERELCVEEVPLAARGRSNTLAMQASERLGFEGHYMRRYVRGCEGRSQCLQGCRAGRKQSLNVNYVPETRERGGTVVSCAPVERVLFEGARAVGVEGTFVEPQTHQRGAAFRVRARRGVLLAASVVYSPLILHRSGVRPRVLGQYFRSHPGVPMFGVYDDPIDMNAGAMQGWSSLAFRNEPGFKLEVLSLPLDMVAGRLQGGGRQLMERLKSFRQIAVWVLGCRAESAGSIAPGFGGKPAIRYDLDRADMQRIRAGLVLIARMHFSCGAREVLPGISGLPYSLGPDELSVLENAPLDMRAYIAILSHLFGGCVMGQDPRDSVCDGSGKVHGRENLWVVDASVIPTNLGVNPQHTIMAMARLFSQQILAAN